MSLEPEQHSHHLIWKKLSFQKCSFARISVTCKVNMKWHRIISRSPAEIKFTVATAVFIIRRTLTSVLKNS